MKQNKVNIKLKRLSKKIIEFHSLESSIEEVDALIYFWDDLSEIKRIISLCECAVSLSLMRSNHQKEFILEKAKELRVENSFSKLKNIKELAKVFGKSEISLQVCKLFPNIIEEIIYYQKFFLIHKIITKNPSIELDKVIDKMTRQYRNNTIFGEKTKVFKIIMKEWVKIDAELKGIKPHKKGIGSHAKQHIKKYKKLFFKKLFVAVNETFPTMSRRQKFILVFKITEKLNLEGIDLYNSKSKEDAIDEYSSFDEYMYRKMKDQKIDVVK